MSLASVASVLVTCCLQNNDLSKLQCNLDFC